MILTGIIGDPISHSLSPAMQNSALNKTRSKLIAPLQGIYTPFHVTKKNLAQFMKLFRTWNFRGLNVTVPHKETILKYCDILTEEAKIIGAVNTLIVDKGKITGTNTDIYGYEKSLRETNFSVAGKTACVLGAGGATRAILLALHRLKIKKIFLSNRTQKKATALKKYFPSLSIVVIPWDELLLKEVLSKSHILINTTSLGLGKDNCSFFLKLPNYLPPKSLVSDIVYRPRITPFLKAAQKRKLKILTGEGMLLHQGALAFELWTNRKAPVDVMKKALMEALHS